MGYMATSGIDRRYDDWVAVRLGEKLGMAQVITKDTPVSHYPPQTGRNNSVKSIIAYFYTRK